MSSTARPFLNPAQDCSARPKSRRCCHFLELVASPWSTVESYPGLLRKTNLSTLQRVAHGRPPPSLFKSCSGRPTNKKQYCSRRRSCQICCVRYAVAPPLSLFTSCSGRPKKKDHGTVEEQRVALPIASSANMRAQYPGRLNIKPIQTHVEIAWADST